MSLVVYKKNGQLTKKKNKNRGGGRIVNFNPNPNQLMYDLGLGAVNGVGELAIRGVRGIVSAFQSRGAGREDIKRIVAPLAKSLTQMGSKPKFVNAAGGICIEHVEALPMVSNEWSRRITSDSFGWLAPIAANFEEYQIDLSFVYVPICPATTVGSVMMAFDYDPEDFTQYANYSDYFNTADHCISAIWSEAAISPEKSKWLKTGNEGDARLRSPGVFQLKITDFTMGYLMVKYKVGLRKPQPASSGYAVFGGTYTTATGITSGGLIGGDASLASIAGGIVTVNKNSNNLIMIWSTDGTPATIIQSSTGDINVLANRTGADASAVFENDPLGSSDGGGTFSLTVSVPGGPTSWKLVISTVPVHPTYFQ